MITIDALLKIPNLKSLRVVAGYEGLNREITSVSVMDAPDSYKWLKGGEFILTTGFIFGGDDWQVEHFINNLIEAGCSAVGIKKGRFLYAIPETVVQIAERDRFPIIEIPYSFGWSDIISVFYSMQYSSPNVTVSDESMYTNAEWHTHRTVGDEKFFHDFMLKLHSEGITTSDINSLKKRHMPDNTTHFSVMLIEGNNKDIVIESIKNTIRNIRLLREISTNISVASVEDVAIILLEVCSKSKKQPDEYQHLLIEELELSTSAIESVYISVGKLYPKAEDIVKSYREAVESSSIGRVILKERHFFFYPLLSIYSTLLKNDISKVNLDYIDKIAYSKEKIDFDGIECLEAYIEYGYKKAAAKLFIHENTLRYRIQKISDLLHLDISDNIICNSLFTQIKLWKLKKAADM